MLKKILKYIVYGIAWGWCWMVGICLIADLFNIVPLKESIFSNFSQNVLASTLTGMAFGTSTIVYTFERLRLYQQVLIHFGIGMGVYFPVAAGYGWMQLESPGIVITFIIMSILVFFAFWSGFYFYNKAEAKKINRQLMELEKEKGNNT